MTRGGGEEEEEGAEEEEGNISRTLRFVAWKG